MTPTQSPIDSQPTTEPRPAGATSPGPSALPYEEVSLLDVVSVLVKRWRLVLGLPFGCALLAAIICIFLRSGYTAKAVFVPEDNSDSSLPSNLAGLAGQFGITLGLGSSESPRFYATLVGSRGISEQVLLTRYPDPRDGAAVGDSVTLLDLLKLRGKDHADTLERGVKKLGDLVSVDIEAQTDVITLSVNTHYATLSAAVANQFVDDINDFNTRSRQSKAAERRQFAATQLVEGEAALREAEDELKTFYEDNRSWQQSPKLVVEEGRLRRRVDGRQEIYVTLKRQYEQARIDAVNNTPVLTVIDRAVPPVKATTPHRAILVLVTFLFTLLVSVFLAFGAEYFDRVRQEEPHAYAKLAGLLREMRVDSARLFRVVVLRRRS